MADREVAMRFCAFRSLANLDDYREFASLDSFLLDFTRRIDGNHATKPAIPEADVARLKADFERAMRAAAVVFDRAAFRKVSRRANRRGPINRALFESWAVALADYEPEQLAPHKAAIVKAARERLENRDYNDAISQGTGDINRVKLRFDEFARDILRDIPKAP